MKRLMVAAALLGATVLATPAQAAITFVNGSFEDGLSFSSPFVTLGTGSSGITGWTISGSIDYIGSYWNASQGSRSIDLNGNFPGQVSQTISGLTSGKKYTVSFDIAGNPDGPPPEKAVTVSVDGVTQTFTYPVTIGGSRTLEWAPHSFTFTAGGESALLAFGPNSTGPYGAALDNVAVSAAVPEPGTWAMMMLGFAGLTIMLRGRRRSRVAA